MYCLLYPLLFRVLPTCVPCTAYFFAQVFRVLPTFLLKCSVYCLL
ncbi:hypothetical protein BMETH_1626_1 [methanotrophic bacterial endosymbiont of Bathymodiolus sp.]|nr:hypothetical protein BMETH_1626_1 [methanotrophic bacterial endosymbiont of Bathymodiolus sp.]